MAMSHLRLLLGSCIVAQTMVLDEPNWHDWTEAHICQCLDGTSLEVLGLEVHPPKKSENDVIRFIVFLDLKKYAMFMWVFPKIGVPQNGWFIMENPMNKWMILGVPLFLETPMFHFLLISHLGGLYIVHLLCLMLRSSRVKSPTKKQVFVQMTQRHRKAILGGGWETFFYFHPDPWGRWTHFDLRIFFRWVGKKHQLATILEQTSVETHVFCFIKAILTLKALYFSVVTLATIGYGAAWCNTTLGLRAKSSIKLAART